MPNPQLEDGYTSIANELLDQFGRLWNIITSKYDFPILCVLIRKTYGYHKKSDKISISQFSQLTGIPPRVICRSLNNLCSANIITKNKNGGINEYGLQKDYSQWVGYQYKLPHDTIDTDTHDIDTLISDTIDNDTTINDKNNTEQCQDCHSPSDTNVTPQSVNIVTPMSDTKDTKENITKDRIQKIEYIQHLKLDDDFYNYFYNLINKYPLIDCNNELILFKEWWENKTKKILKLPKTAWRNWLENAQKFKEENQRNDKYGINKRDTKEIAGQRPNGAFSDIEQ
jgi:phage replication O-like protein O